MAEETKWSGNSLGNTWSDPTCVFLVIPYSFVLPCLQWTLDSHINITTHRALALRCLLSHLSHPVQSAVTSGRYITRSKVPCELYDLPVGFTVHSLCSTPYCFGHRFHSCWGVFEVGSLWIFFSNQTSLQNRKVNPRQFLYSVCFFWFLSSQTLVVYGRALQQHLKVWRHMTCCRIPNIPKSFFFFCSKCVSHLDMWEHINTNVLVSCYKSRSRSYCGNTVLCCFKPCEDFLTCSNLWLDTSVKCSWV